MIDGSDAFNEYRRWRYANDKANREARKRHARRSRRGDDGMLPINLSEQARNKRRDENGRFVAVTEN